MDAAKHETWERPPDMSVAAFEKIVGWDHKRLYGLDFPDKLRDVGFGSVEVIAFSDVEAERHRLAYPGLDLIYVCRP